VALMAPRISLGPILYYWPRAVVDAFYDAVCASAVDIVYLGEVVCGKRHEVGFGDWMAIARRLAAAAKEVLLSCLALTESETICARCGGSSAMASSRSRRTTWAPSALPRRRACRSSSARM